MEGRLRMVKPQSEHPERTNFNDWSDPKYKFQVGKVKSLEKVEEIKEEEEEEEKIEKSSKESFVSHTEEEIENLRRKIQQGYPLLTKQEIRNYRLPFYESLLLNLKEEGFILTYAFIKDLIDVDDTFHKEIETDFSLKNRPNLKYEHNLLTTLAKGLLKAETARLENKQMEEAEAFLDLAIHLSTLQNKSWHWVAQEMFEQCIAVIDQDDSSVTPKLKAIAEYMYASFLFKEKFDLNAAKQFVESSMALSEGKNWSLNIQTDSVEKTNTNLYFASCLLLHEIFLEMANEQQDFSPEDAIQLCRNSLLWAKMINNKAAEANALRKLINIYLSAKQLSPVSELLENYMKLCLEEKYIEGLCVGYILYAQYYDILGETGQAVGAIKDLLNVAEKHQEKNMAAMAHHKLAVYYLRKGHEKELQDHAINAYKFYKDLKSESNMEEARCLVGIAQAQDIMSQYCDLVVRADQLPDLKILMQWKHLRIPFFTKLILFQPEAEFNSQLYNKIELMRAEDVFVAEAKYKHEDIESNPSTTKSKGLSFLFHSGTIDMSSSRTTGLYSTGLLSTATKKSTLMKPKSTLQSSKVNSTKEERELLRDKRSTFMRSKGTMKTDQVNSLMEEGELDH